MSWCIVLGIYWDSGRIWVNKVCIGGWKQLEIPLMLTLIDWIRSQSPASWKIEKISLFSDTFFRQQSWHFLSFILGSLFLFTFRPFSYLASFFFSFWFFRPLSPSFVLRRSLSLSFALFRSLSLSFFVTTSQVRKPVINSTAKSYEAVVYSFDRWITPAAWMAYPLIFNLSNVCSSDQ